MPLQGTLKKSANPITTGRTSMQLLRYVGYVFWTLLLMYIVLADKWLRTSTSSPWHQVPRTWVCTVDPVTRTGSIRSNTPYPTWTPVFPSARLCSSPRNRLRAGQSLGGSLLSLFDCIIFCWTQTIVAFLIFLDYCILKHIALFWQSLIMQKIGR